MLVLLLFRSFVTSYLENTTRDSTANTSKNTYNEQLQRRKTGTGSNALRGVNSSGASVVEPTHPKPARAAPAFSRSPSGPAHARSSSGGGGSSQSNTARGKLGRPSSIASESPLVAASASSPGSAVRTYSSAAVSKRSPLSPSGSTLALHFEEPPAAAVYRLSSPPTMRNLRGNPTVAASPKGASVVRLHMPPSSDHASAAPTTIAPASVETPRQFAEQEGVPVQIAVDIAAGAEMPRSSSGDFDLHPLAIGETTDSAADDEQLTTEP